MSEKLTHAQIWGALDALAARYGLTPSGLARKAGLDPTTFNRSKRETADGRQRWPSTESLAKTLQATGATLDEFMQLVAAQADGPQAGRHVRPLISFAQAESGDYFDDKGAAVPKGWDEIELLAGADEHSYALEIAGDSMAPVYRDGDVIIVSPTTPARRGDRVVVRTKSGEIMARELKRQTARTIELRAFNSAYPDRVLNRAEVSWVARVLWVSQ